MGNSGIVAGLNKAFENRIRLGIMSVLMVNDSIDFKELKELLQTTDGNIASHMNTLETKGYVLISKQFIDKKPNTSYSATKEGKVAFQSHLYALEKLLGSR